MSESKNKIKLFEERQVRAVWDANAEKWWLSIVDICMILTENDYQGARNYWKVLKKRLKDEGNESVTNCNQLKMKASDGKYYKNDKQRFAGISKTIKMPKSGSELINLHKR